MKSRLVSITASAIGEAPWVCDMEPTEATDRRAKCRMRQRDDIRAFAQE